MNFIAERVHASESQTAGRDSAGVELIDLLLFCDVDNREQIAADTGVRRIDHIERCRRRHRGVNGVAPLLQHPQTRLRSQRLHGADDAVSRHDF